MSAGSTSPIMSGCMGTGKPLIAILMAVYEPRMDWLREQLLSLEGQTYPNLKLYVRDDCSPTVPFEEIQGCVEECIRSFHYEVWRNEENLGSNRTFERLTEEAEGEYFAYCDQDDVWLPEKLAVLQEALERERALLVCSDMYIIDGDGKVVADSITKIRRRHKFFSGEGIAKKLLVRNFVTGCTMLIKAQTAKDAMPFCPYMVHDHYLAFFCAAKGKIISKSNSLVKYRLHGKNQTSFLSGVVDKKTYKDIRITQIKQRFLWLQKKFVCDIFIQREIEDGLVWINAREKNWENLGGKILLWKYRKFNLPVSLLELMTSWMPDKFFKQCLSIGKKKII